MKLPAICPYCEQKVDHTSCCEKDRHWDHHGSCCPGRQETRKKKQAK